MALVTFGACVLNSETVSGPKGDRGTDGVPGAPGAPGATTATLDGGTVTLQDIVDLVAAQQQAIAKLEAQVQTLQDDACPASYLPATTPPAQFLPDAIVCTRGKDELVKVGTGGAAFWIDRYEASVWTKPDGPVSGIQKFAPNDDSDAKVFPKNGQATAALYALSIRDTMPAVNITWFQAVEACAASGKRLPTSYDWQRAVRGTFDPGANDGSLVTNKKCNTQVGPANAKRMTGQALVVADPSGSGSCVSDWGAEDMIGNVWEWTADWFAGTSGDAGAPPTETWPDLDGGDFHQDQVANISSSVYVSTPLGLGSDLPAAAIRGGGIRSDIGAGAFAFDLRLSPTYSDWDQGFRCMVPR